MTQLSNIDVELIRGWLSTGFLGFLAFSAARFASPIGAYLTERLKVKAQERKDERDGYGPLIVALQKDIELVRKHHADCEAARREDHQRITALEAQVNGLTRLLGIQAVEGAITLPSSAGTEHILDLAERSATAALDSISKKRGEGKNDE